MKVTLENKDCIEFLKSIPDNSIDLINTDPPYFQIVKNDWDNQWKTEQDYLDWCNEWTTECVRVLKPNRCLYVWGTTKTDTFLRYKLDVLNNMKDMHYQNWIIWHYDWGGRTKKNFARKHEDLFMYSKGKEFLFNADDVREERAVKTNMALQRKINLLEKIIKNPSIVFSDKDAKSWKTYSLNKLGASEYVGALEKFRSKNATFEKGKIPTDVWQKNNHTTSKEYAGWHPTQKPIEILKRTILANTNEGDTVLDIFSGSGSTMIASALCNRNFIGCELDEDYYNKSKTRLKDLTGIII
jgi:DNA modification methylase